MEPKTKEIRIKMPPEAVDKIFDSYESLEQWIQAESRSWTWLESQHSSYVDAYNSLRSTLQNYRNQMSVAQTPETANNVLASMTSYLNKVYSEGIVFTSDSDQGEFILSLKAKDPIVAYGAINFLKDLPIPNRGLNSDIGKQIRGHILANNFRSGLIDEEKIRKRAAAALRETKNSAQVLFGNLESDLNASREAFSAHDTALNSLQEQFSNLVGEAKQTTIDTVNHLQQRATEIETLYREKVQLMAPTQYFNSQASNHTTEANKYFRIFTGITLAFLILFCVLVYVLFSQIQFAKDIEKYLILTAFFAVGTWFVRTYYRIYINHQHLKTVSGEKEVLVKVYLSLLESDKGLSKEDRGLILAPLFRVPQNVFSKDDSGPSSPMEILLRNIQK